MSVAASFRAIKTFDQIFKTGFAWMMEGDGVVVDVLQTAGVVLYLYYYDRETHQLMVQYQGVDPTMPVRRWAKDTADGLPKWDDARSFGDDVQKMRAHMKNNMKNAHGQVSRWLSREARTERYYPVRDISFAEPADYAVPELQKVPAKTRFPMVIPKKTLTDCKKGDSMRWWVVFAVLLLAGIGVFYYTQQCRCVKAQ